MKFNQHLLKFSLVCFQVVFSVIYSYFWETKSFKSYGNYMKDCMAYNAPVRE